MGKFLFPCVSIPIFDKNVIRDEVRNVSNKNFYFYCRKIYEWPLYLDPLQAWWMETWYPFMPSNAMWLTKTSPRRYNMKQYTIHTGSYCYPFIQLYEKSRQSLSLSPESSFDRKFLLVGSVIDYSFTKNVPNIQDCWHAPAPPTELMSRVFISLIPSRNSLNCLNLR